MKIPSVLTSSAFALATVALIATRAEGQDYWTPKGAPNTDAGKMKTLAEVEPRTIISSIPFLITNSGSFYLAGTLCNTNPSHGIIIQADDVKVDLNGFSLNGSTNQPAPEFSGIVINPPGRNITIRNGVVRGWGWYGIDGANASDATVESVKFYNNGLSGVIVGPNSLIDTCTAYFNGFRTLPPFPAGGSRNDGIRTADFCTVRNCKSRGNNGCGVYASTGGRVTDCTASENRANGIFAWSLCTVRDCTVMGNWQGGISVQSQCRVVGNTCGGQTNLNGCGIRIDGMGNRVEDNNTCGNQYGIMVMGTGSNNLITCNSATGNIINDFMLGSADSYGSVVQPSGGSFSNSNPWSNFKF